MEFLLRSNDDEWFDLHKKDFGIALRPNSFDSVIIDGWGDHRIKIDDVEISFSYEDSGIHIMFASEIETEKAHQIVAEILMNIEKITGQSGRIIHL